MKKPALILCALALGWLAFRARFPGASSSDVPSPVPESARSTTAPPRELPGAPSRSPATAIEQAPPRAAAVTEDATQARRNELSAQFTALVAKQPRDALKIWKRLLALDPGLSLPQTQQVASLATVTELRLAAEGGARTDWDDFHDLLERTRRAHRPEEERQLLETEITAEIFEKHDVEEIRRHAEELNARYPETGTGPYHLAWVALEQGNREEALRWMAEAIRREPRQLIYRRTKEALEKGSPLPFELVVFQRIDSPVSAGK